MVQLIPLPLTVSCSSKIQIGFTFLVLAHPGSPGQRAVKWVCVCVYPGCTQNHRWNHDWANIYVNFICSIVSMRAHHRRSKQLRSLRGWQSKGIEAGAASCNSQVSMSQLPVATLCRLPLYSRIVQAVRKWTNPVFVRPTGIRNALSRGTTLFCYGPSDAEEE